MCSQRSLLGGAGTSLQVPSTRTVLPTHRAMAWLSSSISVRTRSQFVLCTDEVRRKLPGLSKIRCGVAVLYRSGGSADGAISINENCDPSVRVDFEGTTARLGRAAGLGDARSTSLFCQSLFGQSIAVPVQDGRFVLGTWQGIYLCSWGANASGGVDHHIVMTARVGSRSESSASQMYASQSRCDIYALNSLSSIQHDDTLSHRRLSHEQCTFGAGLRPQCRARGPSPGRRAQPLSGGFDGWRQRWAQEAGQEGGGGGGGPHQRQHCLPGAEPRLPRR